MKHPQNSSFFAIYQPTHTHTPNTLHLSRHLPDHSYPPTPIHCISHATFILLHRNEPRFRTRTEASTHPTLWSCLVSIACTLSTTTAHIFESFGFFCNPIWVFTARFCSSPAFFPFFDMASVKLVRYRDSGEEVRRVAVQTPLDFHVLEDHVRTKFSLNLGEFLLRWYMCDWFFFILMLHFPCVCLILFFSSWSFLLDLFRFLKALWCERCGTPMQ